MYRHRIPDLILRFPPAHPKEVVRCARLSPAHLTTYTGEGEFLGKAWLGWKSFTRFIEDREESNRRTNEGSVGTRYLIYKKESLNGN